MGEEITACMRCRDDGSVPAGDKMIMTSTRHCVLESELHSCGNYLEEFAQEDSDLPEVEPYMVMGCDKCYVSVGSLEFYM